MHQMVFHIKTRPYVHDAFVNIATLLTSYAPIRFLWNNISLGDVWDMKKNT